MLRDTMWLAPTEHHLMSLRAKRAAGFGVEGGRDGRAGGVWVFDPPADGLDGAPGTGPDSFGAATPLAGVVDPDTHVLDPDGSYVYPFAQAGHATPPGAILRYVNSSAGGWGDPFERDPELVKRDVRDGYVTIAGAARDYGVVVVGDPDEDPEGLALDLEATERRRAGQVART
jgi:N-methylhydantoinase B